MEIIFGIILLVLDIWAVLSVWQSSASGGAKLLWTVGIIVFLLLGFIVWYFAGPKGQAAAA